MKRYLMVLQVRYHAITEDSILIEGAFWQHLLLLSASLSEVDYQLELALIEVDKEIALSFGSSWVNVCPSDFGMVFHSLLLERPGLNAKKWKKLSLLPTVRKKLLDITSGAEVVHTGLSHDVFFPTSFLSLLVAKKVKCKIVFVVDIDFRRSSYMLFKSGEWSFFTFCKNFVVLDVFRFLQMSIGVRSSSLSLLKGRQFAKRYKALGKHVHSFFDVAHNASDVIDSDKLAQLLCERGASKGLSLVYFGRVLAYKGIQDAIEAIRVLVERKVTNVSLTVIGRGNYEKELRCLVEDLRLQNYVNFLGPLEYGKELFSEIQKYDALIALPQSQDTPRSAFDAMAVGLPIISYNTYYYEELAESGGVVTCPWLDIESLSVLLEELSKSKKELATMANGARDFAEKNTQTTWLEKRQKWMVEALDM